MLIAAASIPSSRRHGHRRVVSMVYLCYHRFAYPSKTR
jgi:hypothetical protein